MRLDVILRCCAAGTAISELNPEKTSGKCRMRHILLNKGRSQTVSKCWYRKGACRGQASECRFQLLT